MTAMSKHLPPTTPPAPSQTPIRKVVACSGKKTKAGH